jgi:hypothetical protein
MNASKLPNKSDTKSESSNSDESMQSQSSTPSNAGSKVEDVGDGQNSQDDVKDEDGNATNATDARMGLRDRRKRKVTNYRYSPDLSPAPAPAVERKASSRSNDKSTLNAKSQMSNWLQCDSCHKWRLVNPVLFESLKKLDNFNCRSLQGVTCKDKDDWIAGNESMTGSDGGGSTAADYTRSSNRQRVMASSSSGGKKVNIFAGRYIPGFAGEFSDFE